MPNRISFSQKGWRGTHHPSTGQHLSKPIIKTDKEEEGYYGLNTSSPGPVCFEKVCVPGYFPVFSLKTGDQKHAGWFQILESSSCRSQHFHVSWGIFMKWMCISPKLSFHCQISQDYSWHRTGDRLCMQSTFFSKAILPPTFQGSWCHSNYLNFQKTDLPQSPSVKTPSKITLVTLRRKQGWIWSLYH